MLKSIEREVLGQTGGFASAGSADLRRQWHMSLMVVLALAGSILAALATIDLPRLRATPHMDASEAWLLRSAPLFQHDHGFSPRDSFRG